MKKIFTLISAVAFSTLTYAQTMGIVGQFTDWGTKPDIVMTSFDGVQWEANGVIITIDGGIKFRLDSDWASNWGWDQISAGFPNGTAVAGGFGNDIPGKVGTYDVTFNTNTLEYSFTAVATGYDEIGFTGLFNSYKSVELMSTLNGVDYSKENFFFSEPKVLFKRTAPTETLWGGTGFPSGTAKVVPSASDIPLTVGYYNVSFNKTTLDYKFDTVKVGIIGDAIPNTGWTSDVPMISTDGGITHYLYDFVVADGKIKFRANGGWGTNWGGGTDFPVDTAFLGGSDIAVAAGTYDTISFNRFTGKYCFGCSVEKGLSIKDLEKINSSVFPVPAEDVISFVSDVKDFEVVIRDLAGKEVIRSKNNTVNISELKAGTYIYQLNSGNRFGSGKLIKK